MDETNQDAGAMPQFVVLGAQKSASTFLQDQLDTHPQVHLAPGEVRAFEDPHYERGAVAELPHLFHGLSSDVVRGIKRPDYLGRAEIPARLHHHLPRALLLAVLREPVARAVSSYYHFVRHGFVPLVPIDEAFSLLLEGAWAAQYPRSVEILAYGQYGGHLTRFLEFFPPEQMLVLEQRQLIDRREEVLRRTLTFLGVDATGSLPPARSISNKGVYSTLRLRLLRSKNRHRYLYTPELNRREPRRMTPWGMAYNASVVGVDRLVLSRFDEGRPPQLSPEVRAALQDFYAEDAAVLRELLPLWSVPAPWLSSAI